MKRCHWVSISILVLAFLYSASVEATRILKTAPISFRNHFPLTAALGFGAGAFGRVFSVNLMNSSPSTQTGVRVRAFPVPNTFSDAFDAAPGLTSLISLSFGAGGTPIANGVYLERGPFEIFSGDGISAEFFIRYVGPAGAGFHRTTGAMIFEISTTASHGFLTAGIHSVSGALTGNLADPYSHGQAFNHPISMDVNSGKPF